MGGGQDATLGQYPWLVNLGYQRNGAGETLFKCGGTLIGPRHVVTAAHCVTDLPSGFALAVVRVGEHDLASEQDCQSGVCSPDPQDMKVRKIVFHPSYGKPNAFQNDIAVISLEEEVQQNDFVIPICLPFNDEGDDYLTPEVGVEVTNGTECKEVYAERGGVITPSQICAGGQKGRDSCVGDSGSGLMRSRRDPARQGAARSELIGVVSFGPRLCGTEGVPGVYSRVESFLPWILDTVQEN